MFELDDVAVTSDSRESISSESVPSVVFNDFIKCVVVGDSGVGKTCLITSWASDTRYKLEQLVKTHVSTVWAHDHYRNDPQILAQSVVAIDGCHVSLRLWDTFGYHDKDRGFAYKGADVVLLCYSVAMPRSLANLKRTWIPEICRKAPNTPIVVVGCQADLRYLYRDVKYQTIDKGLMYKVVEEQDITIPEQGRTVAKEIGAPYYECSVLTRYGIQDVFLNVIRTVMATKRRIRFWAASVRQNPRIQAPMALPLLTLPKIDICSDTSVYNDWSELSRDQHDGDIAFIVGGERIQAHKICLAVGSDVFESFLIERQSHLNNSTAPHTFLGVENGCHSNKVHAFDNRFPVAFLTVEEKTGENHFKTGKTTLQTIVTLRNEITPRAFMVVLKYLYTGKVPEDCEYFDDVLLACKLLQITDLTRILCNIKCNESYMNTELENMFRERRKHKIQELALKQELFSDVRFLVDDGVVKAHKPLLKARCEMMHAMFSDDFLESAADSVSLPGICRDVFLAIREFLYTNECPSNTTLHCLAIIEAANRMCLPRLVQVVEAKVVEELTKADDNGDVILGDVFKVLEQAQVHNADQLKIWCLVYLCNHFLSIKPKYMKHFRKLAPDNVKFIEKNRWPPEWYMKEVNYFDNMQAVTTMSKMSKINSLNQNQPCSHKVQCIHWAGCLCFHGK